MVCWTFLKQEALPFIQNYQMNYVHMGKLLLEVRERFTSDVRLLVEYLACKNDSEKIIKLAHEMNQTISHPKRMPFPKKHKEKWHKSGIK